MRLGCAAPGVLKSQQPFAMFRLMSLPPRTVDPIQVVFKGHPMKGLDWCKAIYPKWLPYLHTRLMVVNDQHRAGRMQDVGADIDWWVRQQWSCRRKRGIHSPAHSPLYSS